MAAFDQATGDGSYNLTEPLSHDHEHMLVGHIAECGHNLSVLRDTSAAVNRGTMLAALCLSIIAPRAMPTEQVRVGASAMQAGLQADGKVALYGLFVDTGKADVKLAQCFTRCRT